MVQVGGILFLGILVGKVVLIVLVILVVSFVQPLPLSFIPSKSSFYFKVKSKFWLFTVTHKRLRTLRLKHTIQLKNFYMIFSAQIKLKGKH